MAVPIHAGGRPSVTNRRQAGRELLSNHTAPDRFFAAPLWVAQVAEFKLQTVDAETIRCIASLRVELSTAIEVDGLRTRDPQCGCDADDEYDSHSDLHFVSSAKAFLQLRRDSWRKAEATHACVLLEVCFLGLTYHATAPPNKASVCSVRDE
jgi:hypothetical protein